MKVIRASAAYSRTTQPAPYESKVAKAEIEYSFSEDESTSGEQALQIAMNAAVAQVHATLGLKNTAAPVSASSGAQPVIAGPVVATDTEKPKRGRPAGTKNKDQAGEPETAPAVSADTGPAQPEPNAVAAPTTAAVEQPTANAPATAAPTFTAGDLTKAASALAARLTKAQDKRTAREVVGQVFDKLMPDSKPPRALSSVPENLRGAFIDALEKTAIG